MGDPRAFVTIGRSKVPRRPVEERLQDYRQVYIPVASSELRAQASRCMDCGVPFCNTGCPLHNLIPEWNDLAYRDDWRSAIDRLHATNNFPEFTGTLCPAPCENACVLSINDKAVNIKEIERSVIDRAFDEGWVHAELPPTRTGKRVAIVGSGPAGLAAAQQLNRAGHQVTVFEKDDEPGGLLSYGIPDFKIEKWVVQRRIALLIDEGIEIRTNMHVGVTPTLSDLRTDYDAVLLAVGALAGRDLQLPGRELDGVYLAMDYLVQQNRRVANKAVTDKTISAKGKDVVILGGGDTGADCLGNVHREGAKSVKILTRGKEPPAEASPSAWPDVPFVLTEWPAHEEGGGRHFEVHVVGFDGRDGKVTQVLFDNGDHLDADLVLIAVGFTGPVRDELLQQLDSPFQPSGSISVDDNYETSTPGIFATGDATRGASLIVWAIADGRRAARAIDESLMGTSVLPG